MANGIVKSDPACSFNGKSSVGMRTLLLFLGLVLEDVSQSADHFFFETVHHAAVATLELATVINVDAEVLQALFQEVVNLLQGAYGLLAGAAPAAPLAERIGHDRLLDRLQASEAGRLGRH